MSELRPELVLESYDEEINALDLVVLESISCLLLSYLAVCCNRLACDSSLSLLSSCCALRNVSNVSLLCRCSSVSWSTSRVVNGHYTEKKLSRKKRVCLVLIAFVLAN